MNWLQITFRTRTSALEELEEGLEEFGASSITYQDSEDQPILEPGPGETPLWDDILLTALFSGDFDTAPLLEWLQSRGIESTGIKTETLEDQDWQTKWMEDFRPACFGQRLWVCPTWMEPPEPEAINIMLDPGLAFGSGTHPTTTLCLEWLDGHDLSGKTIIDYGCGSGILAIAAAKLGASRVWALDNDPQALESCRMNAEQNGVGASIHIVDDNHWPQEEKMDVIIANILVTPLVELKPRFLAMAANRCQLVMSGILKGQANRIRECYQYSLPDMEVASQEDWARVSGTLHLS